eukprot:GHVN01022896.1.p1 GENE.GHVN01022896.1~~GHVN01022896.1.p1  ORF type:complete len:215 (+),score=19.02 GHVN01022896.1:1021-1665(+)
MPRGTDTSRLVKEEDEGVAQCCGFNASNNPNYRRCLKCACAARGFCTNCRVRPQCCNRAPSTHVVDQPQMSATPSPPTPPPGLGRFDWPSAWEEIVHSKAFVYDPFQGNVLRRRVAPEVDALTHTDVHSEMLICLPLTLQRDKAVTTSQNIRKLIQEHLDLWQQHKYSQLLNECRRSRRQLTNRRWRRNHDLPETQKHRQVEVLWSEVGGVRRQ